MPTDERASYGPAAQARISRATVARSGPPVLLATRPMTIAIRVV
jgi:hypothetical protein